VEVLEGVGIFAGAESASADAIGRHAWQANAAAGAAGRVMGSADYSYTRYPHAWFFAHVEQDWRLEERVPTSGGDARRFERKRAAVAGIAVPFMGLRRQTIVHVAAEAEDRVDSWAAQPAPGARDIPDRPLSGLSTSVRFSTTSAGLRSISAQDGIRIFGSFDYLTGSGGAWRSGREVALGLYRSFPSWTRAGRPVAAALVRVAEQRGPETSHLTAGGAGTGDDIDSSTFIARGYPLGILASRAMWSVRAEARLPIARISRGIGTLPVYARSLSATAFADAVGAADRMGDPGGADLVSVGAELVGDVTFFSFVPLRVRAGVGVPVRPVRGVAVGEARVFVATGTGF
jgi:hypothetical protein